MCEKTIDRGSEVFSIAFSPCGQLLVIGAHDGAAAIWDVELGLCKTTLSGHHGAVYSAGLCISLNPNSSADPYPFASFH